MPNQDPRIGLAARGEDTSGVMGTNTRQREAFDWTSSLAPPPPPSPVLTGGGQPVPARQHLSVEWDGMRERTCF
jgi:hypothetical protein